MIRPIVKMPVLLSTPSVDATPLDAAVGQDLLDTLARTHTNAWGSRRT